MKNNKTIRLEATEVQKDFWTFDKIANKELVKIKIELDKVVAQIIPISDLT